MTMRTFRTSSGKCSGRGCPSEKPRLPSCSVSASAVAPAIVNEPSTNECGARLTDHPEPPGSFWQSKTTLLGIVAVLAAAFTYLLVERPWISKPLAAEPVTLTASAPAGPADAVPFAPPPHSIAVLPFVNMSGDKEQDYFSDGLTEELLNSLAAINELQVAGRTSAFSFKGKDTDIDTIRAN